MHGATRPASDAASEPEMICIVIGIRLTFWSTYATLAGGVHLVAGESSACSHDSKSWGVV